MMEEERGTKEGNERGRGRGRGNREKGKRDGWMMDRGGGKRGTRGRRGGGKGKEGRRGEGRNIRKGMRRRGDEGTMKTDWIEG